MKIIWIFEKMKIITVKLFDYFTFGPNSVSNTALFKYTR